METLITVYVVGALILAAVTAFGLVVSPPKKPLPIRSHIWACLTWPLFLLLLVSFVTVAAVNLWIDGPPVHRDEGNRLS